MEDRNIIEAFSRWAEEARWKRKALRKVKVVSDLNRSFPYARKIADAAFRSLLSSRDKWDEAETTAGEIGKAFAPGTDLGDLVLIRLGDKDALVRFVERHPHPIHRKLYGFHRWDFWKQIYLLMEQEGKTKEEVLRGIVEYAVGEGAKVISDGWEEAKRRGPYARKKPSRMGRKPIERTVHLGSSPPILLREPTPDQLEAVLSGDAATLGDRFLRVSLVGCGDWRVTSAEQIEVLIRKGVSPEDIARLLREEREVFFREFSPGELALLFREARGFAVDCIMHGRDAALHRMSGAALLKLSGGQTRRMLMVGRRAKREREIELEYIGGTEEVSMLDAGIEIGTHAEISPHLRELEKREEEAKTKESFLNRLKAAPLTDRERKIIVARYYDDKTLKEIAAEHGLSRRYVGNLWPPLKRKFPRK